MPFITMIISLLLLGVYYIIDKLTPHLTDSEKAYEYIYYIEQFLAKTILQLFVLSLTELFITKSTDFSIYEYWLSFPYHMPLLSAYLLFSAYQTYRKAKENNRYTFITDRKNKSKEPLQYLNYALIRQKHFKEIEETKLSLLKNFSPIPIALLVLNNFDNISFKNFEIKEFISSNTLNIFLISIIGIYTYQIFITYLELKNNIKYTMDIEKEIHLCNNPDTFKNK